MKANLTPPLTRRFISNGDLSAWISPRQTPEGTESRVGCTIMFSSGNDHYAIEADRNELGKLYDTIGQILTASTNDIEHWLDDAAAAINSTITARHTDTVQHLAAGGSIKCR